MPLANVRKKKMEMIETHNGYGWTTAIPNQITDEFLAFIRSGSASPVLDIGAGFGVATLPALEAGAKVIANDLQQSHLDTIHCKASQRGLAERLTIVSGQFPGTLHFENIAAIHCSNVLHFLRGSEIVEGAARMYDWLRPGGRVFIQVGTIYAGHIKKLMPLFEERQRQGAKWPGEVENARDFVAREFRDATPGFMNFLFGTPLIDAFESVGFQIDRASYYTRIGLPASLVNDGRENFGLIATKPICQT